MPLSAQQPEFKSWKRVPRVESPSLVIRLDDPPIWAHDSRSRGRKAKGRQWERKFHKLLTVSLGNLIFSGLTLHKGVWFLYRETGDDKDHYAQTDFMVLGRGRGLVIETKATRSPDGIAQLLQLYRPLVEYKWPELQWAFVQAFRHWAGDPKRGPVFGEIDEMLEAHLRAEFRYADLHYTR